MADTIVHTAEGVVDGTVTGLASAVGSLTNEVAHHAETLAEHGEKLTNVDEDAKWIKERLDNLGSTLTEPPSTAIADLEAKLEAVRRDLMAQMGALSERITATPETPETESQTTAPDPAQNAAVRKKPGGLRGLLHRLL
jgi:hypothetical protein